MYLRLLEELSLQWSRLMLWVPVMLSIGIGTYFSLPFEPSVLMISIISFLAVVFAGFAILLSFPSRTVFVLCLLLFLGFLIACLRTHSVSEPVLGWRYYGTIEGTVVAVDRSASKKPRLTLEDPVLENVSKSRTPDRVRISLHSKLDQDIPPPGARVLITGHLSPPSGPVEPGGFDFQRRAWFKKLGAVGYTRNPVMRTSLDAENSWSIYIFKTRMNLSEFIQEKVGGKEGGFAAAILTGDR